MRLWDWIDRTPHPRCGPVVYALYQGADLVYIGHTGNLKNRLPIHRKRFAFDGIKAAPIEDRRERQWLERKLIFRLGPIFNRAVPASARPWWGR